MEFLVILEDLLLMDIIEKIYVSDSINFKYNNKNKKIEIISLANIIKKIIK